MKQFIFFFALITSAFGAAQNQITGKLLDATEQPISYANVLLLNAEDSNLVTGTMSDENGFFAIETSFVGEVLVKISSLGYADGNRGPFSLNGSTVLSIQEPIILQDDTEALDEVQVVARRNLYERQPDRTVVNVQSSAVNAGASALAVIETSPGMTVDRVSGTIGMLGKNGTVVYINGKRTRMTGGALMQMLSGLPSSNIEKLELITNPPASFDAEGTGGVINIVLKNSAEERGLSGTLSSNTGYGDNAKYGGSADVFYNGEKYDLYASINNNNDYNNQPTFIVLDYNLEGSRFRDDLRSNREAFVGLSQARLGGDYKFSENTTVGGEFKIRRNIWDLDALTETTGTQNGAQRFFESLASTEKNNWTHYLVNGHWNQKIGEQTTLSFDYDYLSYANENDATYDETRTTTTETTNRFFLSEAETDVYFHVGRIDLSTKLWKKLDLGIGVKGTISSFTNDVAVFNTTLGTPIREDDLSQIRTLDEDIWAGYVTIDLPLGQRTNINLGTRYEYTDSRLVTLGEDNDVVLDRGQLFPSFRVDHKLNDKVGMSLSYGERIMRPNFNTLSPAFFFFNSTTIVTGNPAIRPVTSRSLAYTINHKRKQFTLQYTDENSPNAWGTPSFSDDFGTTTLIPQPIEDRKLVSTTLSFPLKLTGWIKSNHTLSGFWQQEVPIYEGISLVRTNWYASINSSFQFQMNNRLSADASLSWITPRILGLSSSDTAIGINFGAAYNFSEQWQLAFSFRDVLDRNSFLQFDSSIPENNASLDWIYESEGNVASLSLKHTFGRGKKKSERGYGSQEEQNRVN